jgi:tetratricopeptide (TPR) repeat protein
MTPPALFLCAGFLALQAQTEAPKPAPAKPQTPAYMTAYQEATRIKEPAKKLEALEKWLAENGDKPQASMARTQFVATAVEVHAKDKRKLMQAFQRQTKSTAKIADLSRLHQDLAGNLTRKDLFPGEAAKAARKALGLLKFDAFVRETKAAAEQSKRPVPSDADLRARYYESLAGALDTLGQAQYKAGKLSSAQKTLDKALALNPALGATALALAEIAEKRHKPEQAMEYATRAMLARPSPAAKKRLESAYVKRHAGSLDGLENYLDREYKMRFPPPVHAARYEPGAKRTGRTVLAEVHTGAGCPPCVAADLAFDALMERYSRGELVVVMYHQHIPRPDPMTNDDTRERWKFVSGKGVPTFIVDGKQDGGGGPRSATKEALARIEKLIGPRLETEPGAALTLEAATDGHAVRVSARVGQLKLPAGDLKLRVALVERLVRYSGENGVRYHPNVVRSLASLPVTGAGKLETAFDLAEVAARLEQHIREFEKKDERHNPDGTFRFMSYVHQPDPANLAVAAYLENEKTKEVLQAAWAELGRGAEVSRR